MSTTNTQTNSTIDKNLEIKKEKTITVNEEKLNKLLSEMEILKDTVSKQRYKEAEARQDKKFLLQGHLKRLKGEVIIAWYPMERKGNGASQTVYNLKDEPIEIKEEDSKAEMEIIYKDNVPVGEKLVGHYKTIEGKDIVCDAKEFYRSSAVEKFDKLEDLGQFWLVSFHNPLLPKKIKININFINP